jgi:hypothetical protein
MVQHTGIFRVARGRRLAMASTGQSTSFQIHVNLPDRAAPTPDDSWAR